MAIILFKKILANGYIDSLLVMFNYCKETKKTLYHHYWLLTNTTQHNTKTESKQQILHRHRPGQGRWSRASTRYRHRFPYFASMLKNFPAKKVSLNQLLLLVVQKSETPYLVIYPNGILGFPFSIRKIQLQAKLISNVMEFTLGGC